MRRDLVMLAVCAAWLLSAAPEAAGQEVFHAQGGNDIVMLHELGVIAAAVPDSEDVRVMIILPDARQEKPLKKGDLILMIDGQRVRGLEMLREIYEGAAEGDTVKVGIRRGDERFLTSFEKKAQQEGQVRIMIAGGPGHGGGDMQPLHEFGVVLSERDGEVVIAMRLLLDDAAFEEEDVLRSINGIDVTSLADFREAYEAVAIGDDVSVVVARDGEEIEATRTKADAVTRMRVMGLD